MRRCGLRLSLISGIIFAAGMSCSLLWGAGEDTANRLQTNPPVVTESEESEDAPAADEEQLEESDEENPAELAGQIAGEIADTINENNAEDLLNLATEAKLSAESVLDLTKVVAYCIEAEKKGLDDTSLEYCRQLKLSSQLERGLALANIFMGDNLNIQALPHGWETIRTMALDDLVTSVEVMPDSALAQLAIGRLEMLPGGDVQKAKKALDAAIAAGENAEPLILAEALKYRSILSDQSEEGLDYLRRAMELNQDNPVLLSLLATRLSELHQDEKALEAIDQALEKAPENKNYQKAKAFILASLERYDEAEALFDEAIADSKHELVARVEKGQFLSSIHQNEKAIALFSELIDENEQIPALYFFRSSLYVQEKDYRQAMKDVNRALRIDLNFTDAIQLKGVIYLQQKKYEDAIRIFKILLKQSENKEVAATQLAYAKAQNNDFRGAMTTLKDQLAETPESIELMRCRGDIELMYGQFAAAVETYTKILELVPNDSSVLNNYAWLLATAPDDSVRNGEKALEMAQQAAEKTNYKESHILSTLGAAYAETGNFEEALHWSDQAVALGEKEKNDRLDDLKKEGVSYREQKPWRETPEKAGVAIEPEPENVPEDEENAEFF